MTPWLYLSVLLRSSRFTSHDKRIGGQRELTTPGSLAQKDCVRCYVSIFALMPWQPGLFCGGLSSHACGALWRSVASLRLCLPAFLGAEALDCYARCQLCHPWKRIVWEEQCMPVALLTLMTVVDLPNSQWNAWIFHLAGQPVVSIP